MESLMDGGFTTKRLAAIAVVGICASVVLVLALSWGRSRAHEEAVRSTLPAHGVPADALDWSDDGIPLEEAIEKSGLLAALPPETVAGSPSKVVLDETSRDASGRCGFMILYSSGVKLKMSPGETDLQQQFDRPGADPFVDGRSEAHEIATIEGRPALLLRNGVQRSARSGSVVRSRVTWNMSGVTYVIEAGSDDTPVESLVRIVESMTARAEQNPCPAEASHAVLPNKRIEQNATR